MRAALLPRYTGQVKCIYIDPPYNTGNEGSVYNDNVNSPKIRNGVRDHCDEIDKRLNSVLLDLRSKVMRYSSQVKPISYLKANAAGVLTRLAEQREPLVITQNGEAKAVLQDVASFEETQETLALLKILALGQQDVEAGRVKPVADVVARLRAKRAKV